MKSELEQIQSNISSKKLKIIRPLGLLTNSTQYTKLGSKILGNYSLWKKTTFTNRYNDPRIKYLSPDYFTNKFVLDIGCNEGFLDIQISIRFFPRQINGIDIDSRLIKSARQNLSSLVSKNKKYQDIIAVHEESMQESQIKQQKNRKTKIILKQKKKQKKQQQQKQLQMKKSICKNIEELPLFFQDRIRKYNSLQWYLPQSVQMQSQKMIKPEHQFPLNIKFDGQNIFNLLSRYQNLQYDTILCLKMVKYVHLTFGDQGLRALFRKIFLLLKTHGILILQVHDWQSYRKDRNICQAYSTNFDKIQMKPEDFSRILTDDPQKQFRFQLIFKVEGHKNNKNINSDIQHTMMIFRKSTTLKYFNQE